MIKVKTKTELKAIAKDVLKNAIGCAYYKIADDDEDFGLYAEEKEAVIAYINKYGAAACKAFGEEYVSY